MDFDARISRTVRTMADIEKIKKDLRFGAEERCLKTDDCEKCEYYNPGGICFIPKRVMRDALSVIEQMEQRIKQFMQEQEPLEPVVFGNGKTFEEADTWWYGCPVCKNPVDTTDNFCRKCGRALVWKKGGENDG